MVFDFEHFYNYIGSRYVIPKDLTDYHRVDEKLNALLDMNGKITYREYFDFMSKYFDRCEYPGCFWDILDWEIPVKKFVWKISSFWTNTKFKPEDEHFLWVLKPILKEEEN